MSPGTSCRSASACSCRHISKKFDWMSVPSLTGSIEVSVLPSSVSVTADGKLSRIVLGEILEEHHRQVGSLGLRGARIVLDPTADHVG